MYKKTISYSDFLFNHPTHHVPYELKISPGFRYIIDHVVDRIIRDPLSSYGMIAFGSDHPNLRHLISEVATEYCLNEENAEMVNKDYELFSYFVTYILDDIEAEYGKLGDFDILREMRGALIGEAQAYLKPSTLHDYLDHIYVEI